MNKNLNIIRMLLVPLIYFVRILFKLIYEVGLKLRMAKWKINPSINEF